MVYDSKDIFICFQVFSFDDFIFILWKSFTLDILFLCWLIKFKTQVSFRLRIFWKQQGWRCFQIPPVVRRSPMTADIIVLKITRLWFTQSRLKFLFKDEKILRSMIYELFELIQENRANSSICVRSYKETQSSDLFQMRKANRLKRHLWQRANMKNWGTNVIFYGNQRIKHGMMANIVCQKILEERNGDLIYADFVLGKKKIGSW